MTRRDLSNAWLATLLLFVALAALDSLGLWLSLYGAHIMTIWPAKGLALAACLRADRRSQPRILGAAFAAGVVTKIAFGTGVLAAGYGTAISVACTAAILWLLASTIGTGVDFRRWKSLSAYLGITAVAVALFGFMGATYFTLVSHLDFFGAWLNWSMASLLSYAILTPLLVQLSENRLSALLTQERTRVAGSVLGMAVLSILVFGQSAVIAAYLIPLGLFCVALMAEMEGIVISLFLVAVVAVTLTALGSGPMAVLDGSVAVHVFAAQIFVAVNTFTMLPAAAALDERKLLRASLAAALGEARKFAAGLQESESQHRLIAEQSRDIIVRVRPDMTIKYISPGCRALGFEPAELIDADARTLIHPDDLPILIENTRSLFAGERQDPERSREQRYRTKSGEWVWLQGNPAIVRDASGAPRELLNVFRDVTVQRKTGAALAEALSAAQAATVAKAEFLANMSHELRTPLAGIMGFSRLLQERAELDATSRQYAARVVQSSKALLAILNDVLDFSKLEAGQMEIRPQPVSAASLAGDALDLFTPQAAEKHIALVFDADGLPAQVLLDELRVRQVLLNLVGNAVKFTESGSVTLRVRHAAGELRCEVTDTGPGIPAGKIEKLFQRFSQVDGSSLRSHGGTGLGLAISKGLVEAMAGSIFVHSVEGSGATFGFAIPAPAVAGDAHAQEAA